MTDISEFETIFRCHYRPLTMYALRYTENIDDAEDIVQQSFIDIWERLSGGMAIDNLKAYLYTVVRNGSLTCVIHSPQKSTIQENEMEDISEEERIIRSERDAQLWTAIDRLPKARKRIFLLSKRDGLTYKEIADELGISIKTVEHQISKAIKTLRNTAIKVYFFFFSQKNKGNDGGIFLKTCLTNKRQTFKTWKRILNTPHRKKRVSGS